jgi:hypothetical protein
VGADVLLDLLAHEGVRPALTAFRLAHAAERDRAHGGETAHRETRAPQERAAVDGGRGEPGGNDGQLAAAGVAAPTLGQHS